MGSLHVSAGRSAIRTGPATQPMLCPNNNCMFLTLSLCYSMVNIFMWLRELHGIIICRQINNQSRSHYLTCVVSQQQLHVPHPGLMLQCGQHFCVVEGVAWDHYLQADQQSEQVHVVS